MDFDILPEPAFLRIFDFLPLKDRFRVGRVSQSFRSISQIVNARIKSLDLHDPMFDELDEDQFEVILRLCHHNLREVEFRCDFDLLPAKFSEFTCPQLIDLNLGTNMITAADFARIITNHPNLKSLKWASWTFDDEDDRGRFMTVAEFPPVTLSNLETLHIRGLNDATLERLIDRCPNLKMLEMALRDASSEDIFDRFFRSVPRLESLRLNLVECQIRMENLEWFWRLPLTSLLVMYSNWVLGVEFMANDDFVYKLVEHFTKIECLDLWLIEASDDAVAALAQLEKLRVANLCMNNTEFTDVTIREFSACRQLEELHVYFNTICEQTFFELFRNCPRLSELYVCGVYNEDGGGAIDAESAGMLILELSNTPHRPSITIEIIGHRLSYEDGLQMQSVWESVQVQNAVQHLEQNHGMAVNIRLVDMPPPPPVDEVMQGGDLDVEIGEEQADGGQMDGDQVGGNQPDA